MSSIKLESNASGTGIFTIASPNSSTNRTLTLPDATGTIITTAGGAAISGTTGAFTTTVGVGGATPAASGAGITFPATQSASSDANTLDDYEEGTWTPTFNSITGSPTGTARYVKIGSQVTLTFEQSGGTFTCTGGTGYIAGLPFQSVGANGVVSACGAISNTAVTSALALYDSSGLSQLYVTASFSGATGVGFSITYFV